MQIAVVKETGGKGPYCSLILAVVVMKDVLVFVCFALNVEFARMVSHLSCPIPAFIRSFSESSMITLPIASASIIMTKPKGLQQV